MPRAVPRRRAQAREREHGVRDRHALEIVVTFLERDEHGFELGRQRVAVVERDRLERVCDRCGKVFATGERRGERGEPQGNDRARAARASPRSGRSAIGRRRTRARAPSARTRRRARRAPAIKAALIAPIGGPHAVSVACSQLSPQRDPARSSHTTASSRRPSMSSESPAPYAAFPSRTSCSGPWASDPVLVSLAFRATCSSQSTERFYRLRPAGAERVPWMGCHAQRSSLRSAWPPSSPWQAAVRRQHADDHDRDGGEDAGRPAPDALAVLPRTHRRPMFGQPCHDRHRVERLENGRKRRHVPRTSVDRLLLRLPDREQRGAGKRAPPDRPARSSSSRRLRRRPSRRSARSTHRPTARSRTRRSTNPSLHPSAREAYGDVLGRVARLPRP